MLHPQVSRSVYAYFPRVLLSTLCASSHGICGEIAVMATLNFYVSLEVTTELFKLAMCLFRMTDGVSN